MSMNCIAPGFRIVLTQIRTGLCVERTSEFFRTERLVEPMVEVRHEK